MPQLHQITRQPVTCVFERKSVHYQQNNSYKMHLNGVFTSSKDKQHFSFTISIIISNNRTYFLCYIFVLSQLFQTSQDRIYKTSVVIFIVQTQRRRRRPHHD